MSEKAVSEVGRKEEREGGAVEVAVCVGRRQHRGRFDALHW